jgi:hypothetical protein
MFGRQLDPPGPSTIGGGELEPLMKSTMILDYHAPPFIDGGAVVTDTKASA